MNWESEIEKIKWKKIEREKEEKKVFTTHCTQIVPYKRPAPVKNTSFGRQIARKKETIKWIVRNASKTVRFVFHNMYKLILLYLLLSIVYMLHKDITARIEQRKKEIKALIKKSTYHYTVNKCHPDTRVPALQSLCSKWECEMNRNIESVEIINIFGRVVGDFIDTFVNKLSYKTIGSFAFFLIIYRMFRRRSG